MQRRLNARQRPDQAFLKAVRQRRAQPSRLNRRLNAHKSRYQLWQRVVVIAAISSGVVSATWVSLFFSERVTLGGVPYGIVNTFWQDKTARDAFFGGDRQALHDRLDELGVEEEIKRFYRDRFESEYELDRHIHQLMFDRTGYVGEAYQVDNYGRLYPKTYGSSSFEF